LETVEKVRGQTVWHNQRSAYRTKENAGRTSGPALSPPREHYAAAVDCYKLRGNREKIMTNQ
jgi:hypothetical protein